MLPQPPLGCHAEQSEKPREGGSWCQKGLPLLPPSLLALRPLACPGRLTWAAAQTSKGILTNNKPQLCCACGGNAFWSPGLSSKNHLCLLASCLAWAFWHRGPYIPASRLMVEREGWERTKGSVVSLRGHKFHSAPLRPPVGSGSPGVLARLNLSCLSSVLTVGSEVFGRIGAGNPRSLFLPNSWCFRQGTV